MPIKDHNTHNRFDVAIIGGGFTGSFLALKLQKLGLNVVVFEKVPIKTKTKSNIDGRASAISYSNLQQLKLLGIADLFSSAASNIEEITVVASHLLKLQTKHKLTFNSKKLLNHPFGAVIENNQLIYAFATKLDQNKKITKVYETPINIDKGNHSKLATIQTSNKIFKTQLLVGADGRMSWLRNQLGITSNIRNYNSGAMVFTISHKKNHQQKALELFYPSGPFATIPLTGSRSNIIWSEEISIAKYLSSLPNKEFIKHLKLRLNNRLGQIEIVSKRFYYPLVLHNANKYFDERAVILGDAAHSIHPIAGLGLNLGLHDVLNLTEIVANSLKLGLDFAAKNILNDYEKQRRLEVFKLISMTHFIERIFANNSRLLSLARNNGLGFTDNSMLLKTFFAKVASS